MDFANRMSGETVPVFVEYDCRGRRVRKRFDDGTDPACRRFYIAKDRANQNPKLFRADVNNGTRVREN